MHKVIKVTYREDFFIRLVFEDNSHRAVDIAPYITGNILDLFESAPNLTKIPINPETGSIVWEDGTEISADFLYENSLLEGWEMENKFHGSLMRRSKFNTAHICVLVKEDNVNAYLLLDGKRYPALRISSATFGIHNNISWYHVPFPGDDGVYEPEWEEPQIVFETLEKLIQIVDEAMEKKTEVTIDITEYLLRTGQFLSVEVLSPRAATINARHFKKSRLTQVPPDSASPQGNRRDF